MPNPEAAMPRYTTSLYLAVFNTAALAAVGLAAAFGLIGHIFIDDVSYLTWVSAALLAGVIVYATCQTYRFDRMDSHDEHAIEAAMAFPNFLKAKVFLYLGLCGTLIGLSVFVGHMATEGASATADGITATLAAMKVSMKTAFNATLVGIVAKLWVEVIVFIQGWAVRRLARQEAQEARTGVTSLQGSGIYVTAEDRNEADLRKVLRVAQQVGAL